MSASGPCKSWVSSPAFSHAMILDPQMFRVKKKENQFNPSSKFLVLFYTYANVNEEILAWKKKKQTIMHTKMDNTDCKHDTVQMDPAAFFPSFPTCSQACRVQPSPLLSKLSFVPASTYMLCTYVFLSFCFCNLHYCNTWTTVCCSHFNSTIRKEMRLCPTIVSPPSLPKSLAFPCGQP